MDPPPSQHDVELLWDYMAFHLHSPLNSAQDDYRNFNHLLFNAYKLNFIYTAAVSVGYFHLFFSKKRGLLRGFITPRKGILLLLGYSVVQYYNRVRSSLYQPEVFACARKYEKEVARFNDHFHRLYGNQ